MANVFRVPPKQLPLSSLAPGERFRLAALPDVTGQLISHGLSGSKARLDRESIVHVVGKDGKPATFVRREPAAVYSSGTLVERLP